VYRNCCLTYFSFPLSVPYVLLASFDQNFWLLRKLTEGEKYITRSFVCCACNISMTPYVTVLYLSGVVSSVGRFRVRLRTWVSSGYVFTHKYHSPIVVLGTSFFTLDATQLWQWTTQLHPVRHDLEEASYTSSCYSFYSEGAVEWSTVTLCLFQATCLV
jgi:hypothetical protein